jgi:hypothetical protein
MPTEQCIRDQVVVKHKKIFSSGGSGIGHSGAHWSKLRTTFGFFAYL